jgi:proteasome lid subunit RPN8/RPN11
MGIGPESPGPHGAPAGDAAGAAGAAGRLQDPSVAPDSTTSTLLDDAAAPAGAPDATSGDEPMPVVHVRGPAQDIHPDAAPGEPGIDEQPADPVDDFLDPEFEPVVHQSALDAIRVHGEEDTTVEVCGVLVGRIYENSGAALVYVDDIVRGTHAAGRNSAVTFTADTWAHIDREMDERHPGKRIVGWYHTHPGFGIFLSEMDRFIQRHFFNAPWQTAFVYDPHSEERGMFGWRDGETVKIDFAVDEGRGPDHAIPQRQAASVHPSEGSHADPVPGTTADLLARIDALEARQRWLLAGVAVMALVAIVWPLVLPVVMPTLDRAGGGGGATDPGRLVLPELSTGSGSPSASAVPPRGRSQGGDAPAQVLGPPPQKDANSSIEDAGGERR